MSAAGMDADLVTAIKAVFPQIFPDVAPDAVTSPYATWQQIGGDALRYLDKSAASLRHALIQTSVWAGTRAEANAISRQIEAALCAAAAFTAVPLDAPAALHDPLTRLYGAVQLYSLHGPR